MDALVRAGELSRAQIVSLVGQGCTPEYVTARTWRLSNESHTGKVRTEADIRSDFEKQIMEIDRRHRLQLIADRMKEPI